MATTSRKLTGAPARPSDITPIDGTLPTAGRFPGDARLSLAAASGRRVSARAHDAAVLLHAGGRHRGVDHVGARVYRREHRVRGRLPASVQDVRADAGRWTGLWHMRVMLVDCVQAGKV